MAIWCGQDYRHYEILLVDDHSSDRSVDVIQQAQKQYPQLRLLMASASDDRGKKAAILRGIKAASSEYLVFCDADCRPASPEWLSSVARSFSHNEVVLGFGALEGEGFTAWLSDYETRTTALRYWSYAHRGQAYMGVGRNLAYHTKVIQAPEAINKHKDLLSGDDDLTISEIEDETSVGLLINPNSYTYSPAPKSFKAWWQQKGRHYSTAWRYRPSIKWSLALEGALQLAFYLLLPVAIYALHWPYVLLIISLRWFLSGYLIKSLQPLVQHRRASWYWPFFEMVWVIATTLLHLRNLIFGPPKSW